MITIMSDAFPADLFAATPAPRAIPAGSVLFHRGDPVRTMFLIVAGRVDLVRHLADGRPVTLQRAGPGAILAEASAYASRYHCDAIAARQSSVRSMTVAAFRETLADAPRLGEAWTASLAREVQAMRHRGEILAMRTVAERLDAWLDWHDDALPTKGAWKELASELAVTPEALYREIARRRGNK